MRAARVPALFAMTPNNLPNSLAAQRRSSAARVKRSGTRVGCNCLFGGIAAAILLV
jgi:hypothetical protein